VVINLNVSAVASEMFTTIEVNPIIAQVCSLFQAILALHAAPPNRTDPYYITLLQGSDILAKQGDFTNHLMPWTARIVCVSPMTSDCHDIRVAD